MNDWNARTAAVIGLARAGAPAAKFLLEMGAKVVGYDSKTRENLSDEMRELEALGADLKLGEHGFQGIEACDLIVLSPGLKIHHEPLQSILEAAESRGVEVIGELELASRHLPCPMIAVTGTKGKSTTVKLITEMLRACGVDAHSAGNTGTPLVAMLSQLQEKSWAVVEVSSFQLEKAPTFKPQIAVLLSLLEDHQDYHPTLEQYWETKLKIFANQDAQDIAIFNIDDPRVRAQWQKLRRGLATSARDEEFAAVRRRAAVLELNSPPLETPLVSVDEVPLAGAHNLSNVAAALAATLWALGEEYEEEHNSRLAEAVRNFQSLPHRLEIVARKHGITWVNDSQSTIPDATVAALKAFAAPISLLVGGRAKIEAAAYEKLMREVRDSGARLYLFGEAAPMLYEVALSQNVEKSLIYRENLLADVVRTAIINSSPSETVILSPACASFDQFASYEERGAVFRRLVGQL